MEGKIEKNVLQNLCDFFLNFDFLVITDVKDNSDFVPDLRLPGPLRAVAVPVRAALHALLRAQAARVHDVADRHEALESGEFLTFQRKKECRFRDWEVFEWSSIEEKIEFQAENFRGVGKSACPVKRRSNVAGVQGVDDVVRGPGKRVLLHDQSCHCVENKNKKSRLNSVA